MLRSGRVFRAKWINRVPRSFKHPCFSLCVSSLSSVDCDDSYLRARPRSDLYDLCFGQLYCSTESCFDYGVLTEARSRVIHILERAGIQRSVLWSQGDVYVHADIFTSPGLPYTERGFSEKGAAMLEYWDELEWFWFEGYRFVTPVFTGSMKEEIRRREKVDKGLYRLFCAGSLVDYVFTMRLFGSFMVSLTRANLLVRMWPGATHFHGGWEYLVSHLPFDTVFASDCTKFDMTQSYEVLVSCVLPIFRHFAPQDCDERVNACLHDLVSVLVAHQDGSLVFVDKNNKSGGAMTIFVNMFLQMVMIEYAAVAEGWDLDVGWYCVCGDDNIVSTRTSYCSPFKFFPDFGIVPKYELITDRSSFEFLSHTTFKYCGRYLTRVDVEKFLCGLAYNSDLDLGLYIQKLNSYIDEAAWSPSVWKLLYHRWFALTHKESFTSTTESWSSAMASWKSLAASRRLHLFSDDLLEVESIPVDL
jgi:hypothetical protein